MEGNDDMIEESKLPPKYWSLLKYAFSSLRVCVPVFGLRAGALEVKRKLSSASCTASFTERHSFMSLSKKCLTYKYKVSCAPESVPKHLQKACSVEQVYLFL
jgi:hypothetical protein